MAGGTRSLRNLQLVMQRRHYSPPTEARMRGTICSIRENEVKKDLWVSSQSPSRQGYPRTERTGSWFGPVRNVVRENDERKYDPHHRRQIPLNQITKTRNKVTQMNQHAHSETLHARVKPSSVRALQRLSERGF